MKKAKIFDIDCKHYSYGVSDGFYRKIKRISRWIKVDYKYVTKNHSLYDYADRYCEEQGKAPVLFFRHDNRLYALGQFMRLSTPYAFIDTDGEKALYLDMMALTGIIPY